MQYVRSKDLSAIVPDDFYTAYIEFKRELPIITDSGEDFASKFRILNDLLSILTIAVSTRVSPGRTKNNKEIVSYLKVSIKNVETELQVLERRISNPELFTTSDRSTVSPLRWRHRAIDLSELLTYLDADSAFGYVDGHRAPFTEVVRGFEGLLNIRLGDPRDIKRSVLQRKYKQTAYLEKLISQNSK